jgi:cobalt-zinc-cadmium efflux system outer membrane protein
VLGQRGASVTASRAALDTTRVESEIAWTDVRAATARAYVQLWLAQERAAARKEGSVIATRLDDAVASRVELGAAPEVDGLRTRAERLRAEADAREADALVDAAASQLAFYLGSADGVRADGEYGVPLDAPALGPLTARIDTTPLVRRETSDARAADARVDRERALVRPTPVVELGADVGDPTLPSTNYRATLALDVPLLSMRGPQIEREKATAATARSRAQVEIARGRAELAAAYHTFVAADARAKTLRTGVLVAADAAARATEESYALGRAQLVAVLDASRTRLDTRITLADAIATRAQAWIAIEHLLGTP